MDMNKLNITFFLSILFTLHGCIAEDLSNCLPAYNIDIKFDYHGDDSVSLFDKKIDNIDTYIFSKDGLLVNHITQNKDALNHYKGLRTVLSPGSYRFVSMANITSQTHISDSADYNRARVQARHFTRSSVAPQRIDHLYSNILDVEVLPRGITEKTGEFSSSHMNIALYVQTSTITSTAPDSLLPIIRVHQLPEKMNFALRLDQEVISYRSKLSYEINKEAFSSYLQTFRFTPEHPIHVTVETAKGELLHTLDLQSFIATHQLHSIYNKQEATIEILIRILGTEVSISVPNWGSEDLTPN